LFLLQEVHQLADFLDESHRLFAQFIISCEFGLMVFKGISVTIMNDFLVGGLEVAEVVLVGF
jgi:hypothetical protein